MKKTPGRHQNGSGRPAKTKVHGRVVKSIKVVLTKEDGLKVKGAASKHFGEPDQYLLCRKQRNYEGSTEGEPTIKLWFHRDSQQYLGGPTDQSMFFPNYPHVKSI